jgi:hypothetical protein
MATNTADTILAWLRQAGDHAFRVEGREASTQIAILVQPAAVGVRASRGDQQQYQGLKWRELEHAESNPLIPLIDALAALVRKA